MSFDVFFLRAKSAARRVASGGGGGGGGGRFFCQGVFVFFEAKGISKFKTNNSPEFTQIHQITRICLQDT